MSNYGSYPGPPQEPWGRQPQEPYGQPSDPRGGQASDPWGGTPSSTPPAAPHSPAAYPGYDQGYQQGGYDQGYEPQSPPYNATRQYDQPGYAAMPATDPVWSQPQAEPPRKGGTRVLILVVAVLALLVVAGGVAAVVKLGGSDDNPTGGGALPTSQSADPTRGSDASQDASPAPENSADARFVTAGQCVTNDGSETDPKLKIVECAPKTYEVVRRIDGPTSGEGDASGKCAKEAPGYTNWYFFDSELNDLDFVLCLKSRS